VALPDVSAAPCSFAADAGWEFRHNGLSIDDISGHQATPADNNGQSAERGLKMSVLQDEQHSCS
jgi:hypothetical protein